MSLTRQIVRFLLVSSALLLTSIIVSAQSTDRSQLLKQVEALRNEITQKETLLLAVSDQDKATYAEFLNQRDAGICRLMPREDYDGKLLVQGGGSYYSVTRLSHDYQSRPQVGLERGMLRSGFAGADYGYITDLGDVPVESLTGSHPAVSELAAFVTPNAEPDARIEQRKSGRGLAIGNRVYKGDAPASVGHTYVLRSVIYDWSDTMVALRVVREDDDGSLILVWKILNSFPTPRLIRAEAR